MSTSVNALKLTVGLGAVGVAAFKTGFAAAKKCITKYDGSIKGLTQSQAKLNKFVDMKRKLRSTNQAYDEAQDKVKRLAREMSKVPHPTAAMRQEFQRAVGAAARLKTSATKQRDKLHELRKELQRAGIDTKNFTAHQKKLAAQLERTRQAQARAAKVQRLRESGQKWDERRDKSRGRLMDAAGIGLGVYGLVAANAQVRASQGTLASLGMQAAGLQKVTTAAINYSNAWSGTSTSDFIASAYDIKSGISSLGDVAVGEYTRIAALTGKATKATTDLMTDLFATGYGIHRKAWGKLAATTVEGWQSMSEEEQDIEFGRQFSGGISAAVQRFKTNGSKISQSMMSLGAAATAAGAPMAEQLAILGTLNQKMKAEESGTKYRAFLKAAYGAGENLNLDFVNADTGQLRSLPDIIDEIQSAYGDTLDAAESDELQKAFGTEEAVEFFKALIGQSGTLRKSITAMDGAMKTGTSTTIKMAEAMKAGHGMELLAQQSKNAAAALGESFAPASDYVITSLGSMAVWFQKMSQTYPSTMAWLTGITAGAGTLAVAVAAVGYVGSMAIGGIFKFAAGIKAIGAAMRLSTAFAWLFNAALWANPITWIVAGIVAAVAAIWRLITAWDKLKAAWSTGGVVSAAKTFFGFGDDEEEEESKPANKAQALAKVQQQAVKAESFPELGAGMDMPTGGIAGFADQMRSGGMPMGDGGVNVNLTQDIKIDGNADPKAVKQAVAQANEGLKNQLRGIIKDLFEEERRLAHG